MPYVGRVLLFSRDIALQLGGLNSHFPQAAMIDLVWRFVEGQGAAALGHVAEVLVESTRLQWSDTPDVISECQQILLAHLQRLGINATLEAGLTANIKRVRYQWDATPRVSIIIPTRDRFALLEALYRKPDGRPAISTMSC